MLNGKKIAGRMRELGLTQKDVARALGIAAPTVSQKINGVRPMTLDEAEVLANVLKIEKAEFSSYFFGHVVA